MNNFDSKFGAETLASVPGTPGVYHFWQGDDVIYIGRAKNLKRRLGQYRSAGRRRKHRRMRTVVAKSERLTFEVCATHLDACLLEIRLIQSLKPKLNIVGTYSAIYPYIGVGSVNGYLQFALTNRPEITDDIKYFGAFRSRDISGVAYFALMRLFTYIGHLETRRNKNRKLPKGTHHHVFRRLPVTWIPLWQDFFDGRSRLALNALSEALLESVDARAASSKVEEDLTALAVFWQTEANCLRKAIDVTNYAGSYPVPQVERDPLFLLWRANELDHAWTELGKPDFAVR